MPSTLRTEVRDHLGVLRGTWDSLVGAMPLPSAFLRGWWVDHAATGTPAVVCCFDGDELVGGAAFQLDRPGRGPLSVERVRMLGQGPLAPDHLDVVAAPDRSAQVAAAVVGWLARPGNRVVDLDGLAADGALAAALAADGAPVIDRVGAPFAALPGTGEEYLAARPGKLRSTARRTRKRLEGDGATVRTVDAQDARRALDDLARLHDGRWADGSEFLSAWTRFAAAAADGMAHGDVRISELVSADGEVVATELDLLATGPAGTSLAFYQAGRRTEHEWRGAGTALKAAVVMDACDQGVAEYDLLRGDESYKSDWAEGRRELVRVRTGSGALGKAVAAAAAVWKRQQDAKAVRAATTGQD
jgi:CelD/BcsL family acetyltransferase involved in cellulose biosynthesis